MIEELFHDYPYSERPVLVRKAACLSDCRLHRFALWRIWDESRPYAMFAGLNPSTADESTDDATVLRCMRFTQSWGYGGLCIGNLFAIRSKSPSVLMTVPDPVGLTNDEWLVRLASDAAIVVAAWGNHGTHLSRANQVKELLPNLHCLQRNKSGEPAHPLYLKGSLLPQRYSD